MFSEKRNVLQLLSLLKKHGISRFVVSPGSRHIPIVISMEADSFFTLYSVVDERSASFFALGLIQRFDEPVGIICTSGTASANYCSAISEAYYQELPLLILTADRNPALLDQHEDQMIHQSTMYENVAKRVYNLPIVRDDLDAWHNNRLINEALLELQHHGNGPVQINIPVPEHLDAFSSESLPDERKIDRIDAEQLSNNINSLQDTLEKSRIIVICGEGPVFNKREQEALEKFVQTFDCIVLTDKMSNCHVSYSISNSFPLVQALSSLDARELCPDIVVSLRSNYSFNPEFKGLTFGFGRDNFQNWYISKSGKIVDPFHNLTKVFEMSEPYFFEAVTNGAKPVMDHDYANIWLTLSESIEEPETPYGHINSVGKFLKRIPENSVLHLANSNSVRISQLFSFPNSVEVHCNRGTDGIDGCMSTMVGFASETDKLVFLIIGDLTFFYDMNALWNRHLNKNIRILLCNNGGGAIMHMPNRPQFAAEHLPNYISARHDASAKAWAIDRGFTYLSADNEEDLEKQLDVFVSPYGEKPIILELFSEMLPDTDIFKKYYGTIRRVTVDNSLRGKASALKHKVFRILGIE